MKNKMIAGALIAAVCAIMLLAGGCSAKDLMQVGRAHGLDMTAFKMDAEELIRQDRPGIVWWTYDHWLVMCGMNDKGDVVIANPSRGRFSIDQESFGKLFSGVSFWNGEPVQEIQRATKPLAEGEYFQLNGDLCRAITSIAKGAMMTLNANYIITSVEKELAALNQ